MYKYICPSCKSNQYSSSENKGNEPCVYCGHDGTEIEKAPAGIAVPEAGANEINQGNYSTSMRDLREIQDEILRTKEMRDEQGYDSRLWILANARYWTLKWVLKEDGNV